MIRFKMAFIAGLWFLMMAAGNLVLADIKDPSRFWLALIYLGIGVLFLFLSIKESK